MMFHLGLPLNLPTGVKIPPANGPAFSAKTLPQEKPKVTLSQIGKPNPDQQGTNTSQPNPAGNGSEPNINHHPEVVKRREEHGKAQSTKKKGALALLLAAVSSIGGAIGVQVTAPDYPEGGKDYYGYSRRAPKDPVQYPRGTGSIEQIDTLLKAQLNKETPLLPELQKLEEQDQSKKLSSALQSVWLQTVGNSSVETQKLSTQVINNIFNVDRDRYYDNRYSLKNEHQPAFDKAIKDYTALNISRMGEKPEKEKAIFRQLNQDLLGQTYSKELVSYYITLADKTVDQAKDTYQQYVQDKATNEKFFADYKNAEVQGEKANWKSLCLSLLGIGSGAGAIGLAVAGAKRRRTFQDPLQKHLDNTFQQKLYWINTQNVETLTPLEKSLMGFNIEEEIKNASTSQARAMIALRDLGITKMGEKPTEELAILDKWVKEHFALSPNWEATGRTMDAIEEYYDSLNRSGAYRLPYTRFVITLELFMKTSGLK